MTLFIYALVLNTVCGDTFLKEDLKVNLETEKKKDSTIYSKFSSKRVQMFK